MSMAIPFVEICAAGFTGAEEGTGCVICPDNTFKVETGRQDCNPCAEGFETEGNVGGDSADDCLGNSQIQNIFKKS